MPEWLDKFEQFREMIIGFLLVAIVIYLPNGLVTSFSNFRLIWTKVFRVNETKPRSSGNE